MVSQSNIHYFCFNFFKFIYWLHHILQGLSFQSENQTLALGSESVES